MVEGITLVVYLSIYIGLVATTFYILSYRDHSKKERKFFLEKDLPKITVLIPAYNEESSISKTIDSIMNVDYPNDKLEIIVIDDGSEDKTFEIAKKYRSEQIKILTKKNGGKGSALNLGISKSKGEIILTMDADTVVEPQSLRNMIHSFTNPRVMAVTPAMLVHKPKTIWQRIQNMEYFLGIFLRKAFATLNAVYITPGAFSAYRKEFFEKYGDYDEKNVTEDIEMSLRIQYNGYFIDNSPEAPVYTVAPSTFRTLLVQRRRWYFGYLKNIWKYRGLVSRKYGDLGLFIIPVGLLSTFFAVYITVYSFFKVLSSAFNNFIFYTANNLSFYNFAYFNKYFLERFFFLLFTNVIFLSIIFFISVMGFYLYWARKKVGKISGLVIDLHLFFMFFAILFGFWWTISIVYAIFAKTVRWK